MSEFLMSKLVFTFFMLCCWIIGEIIIYPINKWLFIRKNIFKKYKTKIRNGKLILVGIISYLIATKMKNTIIAGMLVGILFGFISVKTTFPPKHYYMRIRDLFTKNGKEKTK